MASTRLGLPMSGLRPKLDSPLSAGFFHPKLIEAKLNQFRKASKSAGDKEKRDESDQGADSHQSGRFKRLKKTF